MALRVGLSSLLLLLTFCLLHVSGINRAPGLFLRSKRANSFLLEEILQGNLERECVEEVCNYEEAREVFEDHHLTAKFWAQYYNVDQCESAPCGNGGNCTNLVGGFYCTCPAPFHGATCELGPNSRPMAGPDSDNQPDSAPQLKAPPACRTSGPASCEQLCTASDFSFSCSCLSGFRLKSDGRSCEPDGEFPCGQIPDQSNPSQSLCTNHRCPWQVSVLDSWGTELCEGAVLGHSLVLTSAWCLLSALGPNPDPKLVFIRSSGQRRALQVRSVDVHERFSLAHHDYDLALLHMPLPLHPAPFHLCVPVHRDHAENVLMHAGKPLLVGAHGPGARSASLNECRETVRHGVTNKMFCLETAHTPLDSAHPGLSSAHPGLVPDLRTTPAPDRTKDWTLDRTTDRITDRTINRTINRTTDRTTNRTTELRREGQERNSSRTRTIRDKKKLLPHQDQQTVDLDFTSTGPDLDQPDPPVPALPRPPVLLGGAPVVSVAQGTAYLVGLLTSSAPAGGGTHVLVFTKLSRHMTWLQQRLGHMTPPAVPRP